MYKKVYKKCGILKVTSQVKKQHCSPLETSLTHETLTLLESSAHHTKYNSSAPQYPGIYPE